MEQDEGGLRRIAEIMDRVEPRFGSNAIAFAWLTSQPIVGFGGRTPLEMVDDGKSREVFDLLDGLEARHFA